MITENVVILTPTMRETLEALTEKCLMKDYFGDHIAAVRQDGDVATIGHQSIRGYEHLWQFSDAEVEALLCALDCCSWEAEPDHSWQPSTKTVEYFDAYGDVHSIGLQAIIDYFLQEPSTTLPGLHA